MTNLQEGAGVRIEKKGPVTTVILHRPERRNAVDLHAAKALASAFDQFEKDDEALVGVLFGEGGAFCAGADLQAMTEGVLNTLEPPKTGASYERLAQNAPMGPSRMRLSKPVIAAIAGPAVAGGLELALWCDLRVAEEGSVLGVYCRRWGVPLIDGGTVRLPRLIGEARAADLILTGRGVKVDEALAMGLVNRVVPQGEARKATEELATEIARFPQTCMRHDRRSLYEQADLSFEEAMAREFDLGLATIQSGETQDGAARFASGKGRGGDFADI